MKAVEMTEEIIESTLPASLAFLVESLTAKGPNTSPKYLEELLQQAQVQPKDLEAWADYDHPKADGYGRQMVYENEFFEIMVMTWMPGDFSAIHDHGYTQWGAVQIFGPAEHNIFAVKNGTLSLSKHERIAAGEIRKVNHELIHQMGNPTDAPYLTLHIYGSPEHQGGITADSRIYEIEKDRIGYTTGGAFFYLPDSAFEKTEPIEAVDFPTRCFHNVRLAQFVGRLQHDAQAQDLRSQLVEELMTRSE